MGFTPLNVTTDPYQVKSKAEVNETGPAEVTGSSSITGEQHCLHKVPL